MYVCLDQVYVLNRDTASRLAISSPLEAHKSHGIIFHTCGVDVGFDNPIFAVSTLCLFAVCVCFEILEYCTPRLA